MSQVDVNAVVDTLGQKKARHEVAVRIAQSLQKRCINVVAVTSKRKMTSIGG